MRLCINIFLSLSVLLALVVSGCGDVHSSYIAVEGEALGTFVQLKCETSVEPAVIESIIEDVDAEAKASMSIFDESSLLSRINNNQTDSLDIHIANNIALAQRFSELSNGVYDITIRPLTEAWGFGRSVAEQRVNVDSILEFVGCDKLRVEQGRIVKGDSRVQIDLNSIAKGYVVDLVAERLEALDIANYMVNIGGEIRCKGYNGRGQRWSIGIETPYDGNMAMDSFEKVIYVEDQAVATSGNYRRFYLDAEGNKVVHTIDPRTGYSVVSDLLSATVVAPTCAEADAAATMFMAMGATEEALALAELCAESYGWKYYFIYADGEGYRIESSAEYR